MLSKGDDKRSGTRLYRIYSQMKMRCYNPNVLHYKNYGGRGITICDEWNNDFDAFKSWALQNGYSDELTIDRTDNNKGYSPDNCHWESRMRQNSNRRNNHHITFNGETHNIAEWARIIKIPEKTLRSRFRDGWPIERALTEGNSSLK